jgi:hypothetical protein
MYFYESVYENRIILLATYLMKLEFEFNYLIMSD